MTPAPKSNRFVYIPGSGGGAPDLSALQGMSEDVMDFEIIKYPGWRQCVDPDFSAGKLVSQLSNEIEKKVPFGPIRIVGLSLGGHFAYLTALHLQTRGREVEAVCAIDSFIVSTDAPTPGWQRRAVAEVIEDIYKWRPAELLRFARSRTWRAMLRIVGGDLPRLLGLILKVDWLSYAIECDPILRHELNMRMLVRLVAPCLATIDENPRRLSVPVSLMRTRSTASSDAAWMARCPNLAVFEIKGQHHTLFEPENVSSLRDAFVAASRIYRTSNA